MNIVNLWTVVGTSASEERCSPASLRCPTVGPKQTTNVSAHVCMTGNAQSSFLTALSWMQSDLVGCTLLDVIHPDDLLSVSDALNSAVSYLDRGHLLETLAKFDDPVIKASGLRLDSHQ
ncbi:hypothetical protein EG68_09712 [Paragonimus skrjabini miyazakii]|uniref:PAS fold-3 domain-containing protein n=1 Tax=Paragonimus skrjabini miyazakii TaxID=59628 RepID=A0A8S9YWP2_9TREM|nr:hypothetical protein EG68_09712 [Paragonimus skrjabini miyazakii]